MNRVIPSRPQIKTTVENVKFGNVKLPSPQRIEFHMYLTGLYKCLYMSNFKNQCERITFYDCDRTDKVYRYIADIKKLQFECVVWRTTGHTIAYKEVMRTRYVTKKCLLGSVTPSSIISPEAVMQMEIEFHLQGKLLTILL